MKKHTNSSGLLLHGSSVAIGKSITITFNGTDGAAKQPIAHTCPCELELSVNYATSIEFATDFKLILASEWSMTTDNYQDQLSWNLSLTLEP